MPTINYLSAKILFFLISEKHRASGILCEREEEREEEKESGAQEVRDMKSELVCESDGLERDREDSLRENDSGEDSVGAFRRE